MKLRRWIGTLAIAMIIFFAYGMPSYAANPESEFHFSNYDGVGRITGYKGTLKEVVIPGTIGGVKVEVIGFNSFRNKGITSVSIPEGVTKIEEYAFSENRISALELPESLVSIGVDAFESNQLTDIQLPNSLEYLSGFGGNQIGSVEIPSSVTSIGYGAFSGNQLVNLELPNKLTSLGDYAFAENQLISLKIPSSLKIIGSSSFSSNQIVTLEIPEGIETIGGYAFRSNLIKTVMLPENLSTIERGAFSNNKLTDVRIPQTVTSIGDRAFSSNEIRTLSLPLGLTEIGDSAFYHNKLTDVVIPGSVKEIGNSAFLWNYIQTLSLGEGITKIMFQAFNSNHLTSVGIPRSVTYYATAEGKYRNLTEINELKTSFDSGVSLYWLGEEPATGIRYETVTEAIPFDTKVEEDPKSPKGTEVVVQEGVAGEKTVRYRLQYVDGEETGREVIQENVTKVPVDKIIRIGILETRQETETQAIAYDTIRTEDPELERGREIVKQEGVDGEGKVTYQVSYVHGEEISRRVERIEVIRKPVDKIVVVGTFGEAAPLILDVDGDDSVTISDVQALYLHVMGIVPLDYEKSAIDYNHDGLISITDVQALFLHVMKIQLITE